MSENRVKKVVFDYLDNIFKNVEISRYPETNRIRGVIGNNLIFDHWVFRNNVLNVSKEMYITIKYMFNLGDEETVDLIKEYISNIIQSDLSLSAFYPGL